MFGIKSDNSGGESPVNLSGLTSQQFSRSFVVIECLVYGFLSISQLYPCSLFFCTQRFIYVLNFSFLFCSRYLSFSSTYLLLCVCHSDKYVCICFLIWSAMIFLFTVSMSIDQLIQPCREKHSKYIQSIFNKCFVSETLKP